MRKAAGSARFGHTEPQGDGALARRDLERILQHFAQQTDAIFERAAILVVALIGTERQEVAENGKIMGGVDIDDVVSRLFGA